MLIWTMVWRNLIIFAHNIFIFVGMGIYAGVPVTAASLLVVPGLILTCLNGIWMATILGVVCARYRDLQQVVGSLMQVSMFVTPIFFTRDQLGPRFSRFVDFNVSTRGHPPQLPSEQAVEAMLPVSSRRHDTAKNGPRNKAKIFTPSLWTLNQISLLTIALEKEEKA